MYLYVCKYVQQATSCNSCIQLYIASNIKSRNVHPYILRMYTVQIMLGPKTNIRSILEYIQIFECNFGFLNIC